MDWTGFQDQWEAMDLLRWWLICATLNINFWSTLFSMYLFLARSDLFFLLIIVCRCLLSTRNWLRTIFLFVKEERKTLPIYPYRDQLLQAVNDYQVGFFLSFFFFGWMSIALCSNISKTYLFTTFHKRKKALQPRGRLGVLY